MKHLTSCINSNRKIGLWSQTEYKNPTQTIAWAYELKEMHQASAPAIICKIAKQLQGIKLFF